jgi:hypothetical protein
MTGYIPKKVMYISSKAHKLGSFWEEKDLDIKEEEKIEVLPTFCADAENPKTIQTGRYWAGRDKANPAKEQVFDNEPMTSVKIISLERRSEGGRAYKVIAKRDDKNFFFDLREDVLLDTMLSVGVDKGGYLNGRFVWAIVGSQMKIIRVDSKLYNAMMELTNMRTLPVLKDLEIGGVYSGKNGQEYIYWGRVDYVFIKYDWRDNYEAKSSLKKNVMLFEKYHPDLRDYRMFEYKTSHVLLKKVKNVKVPSEC